MAATRNGKMRRCQFYYKDWQGVCYIRGFKTKSEAEQWERDFLQQQQKDPDRHRGHVVKDSYPESKTNSTGNTISYDNFVSGIINRGMDSFVANGLRIVGDTTDFDKINREDLLKEICDLRQAILNGAHVQLEKEDI